MTGSREEAPPGRSKTQCVLRALLLGVAGALVLATAAHGKGPSQATVAGAGLDEPITLAGMGEPDNGTPLGAFAESAGFFQTTFGQTPDSTVRERPAGRLGPRYTITYRVPAPDGSTDTIRQDLYPYAGPGPLTYTKPGQPFFDGERTDGGWYHAGPGLKTMLVDRGLPASAPSSAAGDGSSAFDARWPLLAAGFAGLALLAAASLVVVRRRLRAPATP